MPVSWIVNPTVVQTIDTTLFGSPDPAGLTYIPGATPGTGRLLLVDSEVDERPFFRLNNLFTLTETGQFLFSTNLASGVTIEPTGIAYAGNTNQLFISDDDQRSIYIVSAADPGTRLGRIDVSAISTDTEDPFYDPASGHLFFLEGGGGINARTIYELTTSGEVINSLVLPRKSGDVEALAYDSVHNVFYVSGGASPNIYVISRDGVILDTITALTGLTNPISGIAVAPKGLILAPSSDPNDDPSVMSLWVADYGRDQVMDGRMFEIKLGAWAASTLPPVFTAGADTVNFNTLVPSQVDTATYHNGLDGDDMVILPSTATVATALGFSQKATFSAGAGNDTVIGGNLGDTIDGGTGNDLLQGGGGADRLFGGDGEDVLVGGSEADALFGGGGNDVLNAGAGNDSVDGGAGTDVLILTGNRADYSFAGALATGVTITGSGTGAADGVDTVKNVESVVFADGVLTMDALLNNAAPADVAFSGGVTENAAPGTVVGTVTATDPNIAGGDFIRFSLLPDSAGPFVIDPVTGVITLAGTVDAENPAPYTVTVRVTDSGGLFHDQAFTIAVGDVNEFAVTAPADSDATPNAVAENAAIGTVVGITASAGDADATTNAITYSLSDDAGGRFAIDAATGVVTVAGALDRETDGASLQIEVTATSADGSSKAQSFTIAIGDVNESPVSTPTDADDAPNAVTEGAAIGTVVGITALATDSDAPVDSVTYSLSDSAGGRFAIDATSGVVTVAGALDREADGPSLQIEVTATSSDGSSKAQAFTIALGDANEFAVSTPADSDATPNAVAEGAAIGTLVGITASASDADATTNTVTYSLSNDAGGRFAIDAATGVVTLAGAVDLETDGASLQIEVTATSADGSSKAQSFTVALGDVNETPVTVPVDADNAPDTVTEGAAAGTLVGITALATDPDAPVDSVTYSLSDDAGGRFAIDAATGVVTLAGALDRETDGASLQIEVTAASSDGSSKAQSFTIAIGDANEFAVSSPADSDATPNAVAENAAIGTVVGITASASDADATTNAVTYSLSNNAGGRFAIDAATGVVTLAGALDRETDGASLQIEVTAASADGSSKAQAYTIGIGDANEFAVSTPADSDATPNAVAENAAIGTVVGITASAGDADATTNAVTYSLSNNAGGRFAINAATGVVTLAGALDRETDGASLQIEVTAASSDGSSKAQSFTIGIGDVNEFAVTAPTDANATANAAVEGAAIGTVVGITASAGDADATTNAITYSLSDNAGGRFAIDATTGVVTVAGVLDRSVATSHAITVRAASADGSFADSAFTIAVLAGAATVTVTLNSSANTYVAPGSDNYLVNALGGNDNVTTNGGNDTIVGGAGNDTISSGGGNDTIRYDTGSNGFDAVNGGAGTNDRILATANAVTIGLASLVGVEQVDAAGFTGVKIVGSSSANLLDFSAVTLTGITLIDGGAGNDTLIGSALADTIVGNSGNDVIQAGGGDDTILFDGGSNGTDAVDGGAGTDRLLATANSATLTLSSLAGIEIIDGGGFSGVRLLGTSSADTFDFTQVSLVGISAIDAGSGNDTIRGSEGADVIVSGSGNDLLTGGGGDDVFLVGTSAGTDSYDGQGGFDRIVASQSGVTLTVTGTNIAGIEEISSGGFSGFTLAGTSSSNVLDFSAVAMSGVALIAGGGGNDVITGSATADVIDGGVGRDTLTGGFGADTFVFARTSDSQGSNIDRITDFLHGEDRLDLSAIDANLGLSGNDAFTFIGDGPFTGVAGQLRFDTTSVAGVTRVLADVDGNGTVDLEVRLTGTHVLTSGDFIL